MSTGTAIFLSALMIGVVILYRSTKDQWNWKKGIKRGFAAVIGLVVVLTSWYMIYEWNSKRPRKHDSYMGIALRITEDEVLFLKGKPNKDSEPDFWVYDLPESSSNNKDGAWIAIRFKNKKIRIVEAVPYGNPGRWQYNLDQVSIGDSSEEVVKKFGQDYTISASEDGLNRIYSFPKFQIFFALAANRVENLGIYDPTGGPVRFEKEKQNSPKATKSKDPLGLFGPDNPALTA